MPEVASPPSASRSTTTTLAPDFAKASAVARPMPFAAPVISATLPVKSSSIVASSRRSARHLYGKKQPRNIRCAAAAIAAHRETAFADAPGASARRPHRDHVLREDHLLLADQRPVARRLQVSGEQPDAICGVRDDLGDGAVG